MQEIEALQWSLLCAPKHEEEEEKKKKQSLGVTHLPILVSGLKCKTMLAKLCLFFGGVMGVWNEKSEKKISTRRLTQSKSLAWIVRKLNQSPHFWVSSIEIFLKHYAFLAAFEMQRGHTYSSLRAEVENYLRDLWILMGSVTSIPGCLCES